MNTRTEVASKGVGWLLAGALLGMVAGCATAPKTPPLDPDLKLMAEGASAAYQRGELQRADELYQRALRRARLIDAGAEVSRNAYNLALCRLGMGRLTEAQNLLRQAAALAGDQGVEVARILLAESEVARLSGEPAESEQLASEAIAAGADREGRVHSLILQAEAAVQVDHLTGALGLYKEARSASSRKTPPMLKARLDGLAVRLVQARLLEGDEAVFQLGRAQWLKVAGQFGMMVQALDGAAARYEQDQKWNDAFHCRIRATQSLLAAGDRVSAQAMLRKAAELAERTGDAGNKALVTGLAGDIK